PGQLLLQRPLISLEPLTVLGGEPDRVLVRNVDARDGGGPVGVHLLRQLAGQLDRLDLRREGTAEHPLDEVLDSLLEVSQNADPKLLKRYWGTSLRATCPVRPVTILRCRHGKHGRRLASPSPPESGHSARPAALDRRSSSGDRRRPVDRPRGAVTELH